MTLDEPIDSLPGTSVITFRKFKSVGINTFIDLINYFPFRYENYSLISDIDKLQFGESVTIKGNIIDSKYQVTRSGLRLQVFTIADQTGKMDIGFYNQPFLLRILKKGIKASFSGIVERYGNKMTLQPKSYDFGEVNIHTGRIIPIYPEKRGLSSRTLREKIFLTLNFLKPNLESEEAELLPDKIIGFNNLMKQYDAYRQIHFPDSITSSLKARERLSFDELFIVQLSSKFVKNSWAKIKIGHKLKVNEKNNIALKKFIGQLPFELTNSQHKVWQEIFNDLQKEKPMNRFLQGEVGSGKTVIAALSCYFAFLNGKQSLFMAPTEILAQQHFDTINLLFEKLIGKNKPSISLITSNTKVSSLEKTKTKIRNTKLEILNVDIIVGTHSLINKTLNFNKVGLVRVDEQQRFGVAQRAELKKKE